MHKLIPKLIKPLLILDNDDVLQIFGSMLYHFHNKRYQTAYTEKDMKEYDLSIVWGCTKEEVVRRLSEYYRSDEHWNAEPVEGAVEVLILLSEILRYVVVTAKPDWLEQEQKAYHDRHFPELIEDVHFTNQCNDSGKRRTKLEICQELNPVGVVEDNLDNANQIAAGGFPVYLLDKVWNKGETHPLVTRFPNWYELGTYLLEKYKQTSPA